MINLMGIRFIVSFWARILSDSFSITWKFLRFFNFLNETEIRSKGSSLLEAVVVKRVLIRVPISYFFKQGLDGN